MMHTVIRRVVSVNLCLLQDLLRKEQATDWFGLSSLHSLTPPNAQHRPEIRFQPIKSPGPSALRLSSSAAVVTHRNTTRQSFSSP